MAEVGVVEVPKDGVEKAEEDDGRCWIVNMLIAIFLYYLYINLYIFSDTLYKSIILSLLQLLLLSKY